MRRYFERIKQENELTQRRILAEQGKTHFHTPKPLELAESLVHKEYARGPSFWVWVLFFMWFLPAVICYLLK